jgi:hypothetical protein
MTFCTCADGFSKFFVSFVDKVRQQFINLSLKGLCHEINNFLKTHNSKNSAF